MQVNDITPEHWQETGGCHFVAELAGAVSVNVSANRPTVVSEWTFIVGDNVSKLRADTSEETVTELIWNAVRRELTDALARL
jgi:hypothetical protein